MRRLVSLIARFRQDRRGALVAEFALTLPMLLILVMCGAEVSRYILINQKMDRAASSMADLVAQEETMTTATLNGLFNAVAPTMKPFTLGSAGVVIVSSIGPGSGNTAKINWQRTGVGTLSKGSKIGTQGGTATLPAGMTVKAGETVIAVEVYFNFTTLFVPTTYTDVMSNQTLYHRAFFRPRVGTLDSIT